MLTLLDKLDELEKRLKEARKESQKIYEDYGEKENEYQRTYNSFDD